MIILNLYIEMLQDLNSDINLAYSPHVTEKRKIEILSIARSKAQNIDKIFPDGVESVISAELDKAIENNACCDLITDGDGWKVGE